MAVQASLAALVPEPQGGDRPIGLMPMCIRIWPGAAWAGLLLTVQRGLGAQRGQVTVIWVLP